MPLVSLTRATLRRAEFGFLGVVVYTRVQTPRFWGHSRRAGLLPLIFNFSRPLRISWLIVGMKPKVPFFERTAHAKGVQSIRKKGVSFIGFDTPCQAKRPAANPVSRADRLGVRTGQTAGCRKL